MKRTTEFIRLSLPLLLISGTLVFAQHPAVQDRVAVLKTSLAASQATLKDYEWVETTVISLKGDEKSRQMNKCYHGADGMVQKIPLGTPGPATQKRGLRARIAESKKEELTDYMREAVALVKSYVPPQPGLVEKAKDAGKASITPLPGERVRLTFADYLKTGDSLAVDLDLVNNRPLSAKVTTYLEAQKDAVTLDAKFGTLDNGATYTSSVQLEARAKKMTVSVQNSGYRKSGN